MRIILFFLAFLAITIAAAQPTASFTTSKTKVCSGSKVMLTNSSTNATGFKWLIEDTLYSTSENDSVIMIGTCSDLQSIKLIAEDASKGLSDTLMRLVEVFDSCAMHLHGDFTNCVGDTILYRINQEAISQRWEITPYHVLFAGCETCDSDMFVLNVIGTSVKLRSTYDGGCRQNVTFHNWMCNPLTDDVRDPETPKVNIYPNPVANIVHLDLKTNEDLACIRIYNSTGMLVYMADNPVSTSLDLSALQAGLYYIKLQLAKSIVTEKLIKL